MGAIAGGLLAFAGFAGAAYEAKNALLPHPPGTRPPPPMASQAAQNQQAVLNTAQAAAAQRGRQSTILDGDSLGSNGDMLGP